MNGCRRFFSLILGVSFLFASKGFASLFEPGFEPTTAFYKTPESRFVSGYASRTNLLSQTRQSYTDFSFEAKVGNKNVSVLNEHILKEMDLAWKAQVKKSTPLYLFQDTTSSQQGQLSKGQIIEIESLKGPWARVVLSPLKKGYVLINNLKAFESDPGIWMNLAPVTLLKEAKDNAARTVSLPRLSRLQLVKADGAFGLFKSGSYSGFVAFRDLVGRVDLATWGWHTEEKKWLRISYRQGADVIVIPNRKVAMTHFSAFQEDHNRALISGHHPTLSMGTRLDLVKPMVTRWIQSELKGHGLVWWKKDLLKEDTVVEEISTAALLRKNLKGLSYDSKTKKGLASAGGIYKTLDGKIWKKLAFFGNDDWPVLLHPDGVWFAGHYRSTDEGKTFEPTLKWNEIAKLLQTSTQNKSKAFIHLKVLDLVALPKSQMMMKIDTGVRVTQLKSHVLSNDWRVQ